MQRQSFLLLGGLAIVAVTCWWLREDTSALATLAAPSPASALVPAHELGAPTATNAADTPGTDPQRTSAMPRQPQLTGRLVQGGQPLANVLLRLHHIVRYVPTATDQTVTTAADGTFATEGLPTAFWLRAEAPSVPFEWATSHQAPVRADRDLGDVEPPLAIALDLLVVDSTGRPVPEPRCWLSRGEIHVNLDPRDIRAPRLVFGDANGRAHLDRLHPGPLNLEVTADGFAMVRQVVDLDTTPITKPLQVTLTRGSRLVGRVFDWRGQPLPGAVASVEGRQAVTDAEGTFVFDAYGGAETLHVEAKGHESWWAWPSGQRSDLSRIQLRRTVVLRGVVRGGNAATSIVLAGAPDVPQGVPWPGPQDQLTRLHPVAADGSFSIDGLVPSDFVVHARAEGLGASAGHRVALRGDLDVELTIDPMAAIALRVVDDEGRTIEPVEVVCDRGIVTYPDLFGPHGSDIPARLFDEQDRLDVLASAGTARVPAARDEPLALGVRSPGFLPEVRTFGPGEAPPELTIVLARGGSVQGIVRGGRGPAYLRQVSIWPAEQDAKVRARQAQASSLQVDAQGRFLSGTLPPGDYLAAVHRYGRARIGNRPDAHPTAVPLVDEAEDWRSVVHFAVVGGATTTIDLTEPALGTLRGRVLLSGRGCAGAWVVAARPGAKLFEEVAGRGETIDWDDEGHLSFVAGQRSGTDGSFTFLYRDAGPLEVRVRAANGAATMPPVLVDLPPPGDPLNRDLEIAFGSIRGRFVDAASPGTGFGERPVEAVLFPIGKAAADPFFSTEWSLPLAWGCKTCALGADGTFGFDHLPDGEWIVRVTNSFDHSFVQRAVTIRGGATDLGELRRPAVVDTKLVWSWPTSAPPHHVRGVWLFDARDGKPTVWTATFAAGDLGAQCHGLAPARYLAVVFGSRSADDSFVHHRTFRGISGDPIARPFAFEVRADGTCVPTTIELVPEPANVR